MVVGFGRGVARGLWDVFSFKSQVSDFLELKSFYFGLRRNTSQLLNTSYAR